MIWRYTHRIVFGVVVDFRGERDVGICYEGPVVSSTDSGNASALLSRAEIAADEVSVMAYSVAVKTTRDVPMQLMKPVLLTIIILLFASACGQKGPLYLPGSDQAPTQTQDGQSNEQKEKEDSEAHEKNA